MFTPIRLATALTATVLLAGCGAVPAAPRPATAVAANRVAAADFDRMEMEYTYRLGSKAAKAFMADAEKAAEGFRKLKTTCELKADGGFFGTTIHVKLAGSMANVAALREELDKLHKALK